MEHKEGFGAKKTEIKKKGAVSTAPPAISVNVVLRHQVTEVYFEESYLPETT